MKFPLGLDMAAWVWANLSWHPLTLQSCAGWLLQIPRWGSYHQVGSVTGFHHLLTIHAVQYAIYQTAAVSTSWEAEGWEDEASQYT